MAEAVIPASLKIQPPPPELARQPPFRPAATRQGKDRVEAQFGDSLPC